MAHETINGTHRQTNLLNESAEYLSQREQLRLAEIELMKQREKVAELRRQLPAGAILKDYELLEGPASLQEGDEPMCTSWLDCFNGIAHHLAQTIELAVVAAADLPALRAHARDRGWSKLRLLSAGGTTFKFDLGSEDAEGNQDSAISVFTLDKKGKVRHFYTVHPRLADDIDTRGIDEYNPIWNILDLTPRGRENWDASLDYGTRVSLARH